MTTTAKPQAVKPQDISLFMDYTKINTPVKNLPPYMVRKTNLFIDYQQRNNITNAYLLQFYNFISVCIAGRAYDVYSFVNQQGLYVVSFKQQDFANFVGKPTAMDGGFFSAFSKILTILAQDKTVFESIVNVKRGVYHATLTHWGFENLTATKEIGFVAYDPRMTLDLSWKELRLYEFIRQWDKVGVTPKIMTSQIAKFFALGGNPNSQNYLTQAVNDIYTLCVSVSKQTDYLVVPIAINETPTQTFYKSDITAFAFMTIKKSATGRYADEHKDRIRKAKHLMRTQASVIVRGSNPCQDYFDKVLGAKGVLGKEYIKPFAVNEKVHNNLLANPKLSASFILNLLTNNLKNISKAQQSCKTLTYDETTLASLDEMGFLDFDFELDRTIEQSLADEYNNPALVLDNANLQALQADPTDPSQDWAMSVEPMQGLVDTDNQDGDSQDDLTKDGWSATQLSKMLDNAPALNLTSQEIIERLIAPTPANVGDDVIVPEYAQTNKGLMKCVANPTNESELRELYLPVSFFQVRENPNSQTGFEVVQINLVADNRSKAKRPKNPNKRGAKKLDAKQRAGLMPAEQAYHNSLKVENYIINKAGEFEYLKTHSELCAEVAERLKKANTKKEKTKIARELDSFFGVHNNPTNTQVASVAERLDLLSPNQNQNALDSQADSQNNANDDDLTDNDRDNDSDSNDDGGSTGIGAGNTADSESDTVPFDDDEIIALEMGEPYAFDENPLSFAVSVPSVTANANGLEILEVQIPEPTPTADTPATNKPFFTLNPFAIIEMNDSELAELTDLLLDKSLDMDLLKRTVKRLGFDTTKGCIKSCNNYIARQKSKNMPIGSICGLYNKSFHENWGKTYLEQQERQAQLRKERQAEKQASQVADNLFVKALKEQQESQRQVAKQRQTKELSNQFEITLYERICLLGAELQAIFAEKVKEKAGFLGSALFAKATNIDETNSVIASTPLRIYAKAVADELNLSNLFADEPAYA